MKITSLYLARKSDVFLPKKRLFAFCEPEKKRVLVFFETGGPEWFKHAVKRFEVKPFETIPEQRALFYNVFEVFVTDKGKVHLPPVLAEIMSIKSAGQLAMTRKSNCLELKVLPT